MKGLFYAESKLKLQAAFDTFHYSDIFPEYTENEVSTRDYFCKKGPIKSKGRVKAPKETPEETDRLRALDED